MSAFAGFTKPHRRLTGGASDVAGVVSVLSGSFMVYSPKSHTARSRPFLFLRGERGPVTCHHGRMTPPTPVVWGNGAQSAAVIAPRSVARVAPMPMQPQLRPPLPPIAGDNGLTTDKGLIPSAPSSVAGCIDAFPPHHTSLVHPARWLSFGRAPLQPLPMPTPLPIIAPAANVGAWRAGVAAHTMTAATARHRTAQQRGRGRLRARIFRGWAYKRDYSPDLQEVRTCKRCVFQRKSGETRKQPATAPMIARLRCNEKQRSKKRAGKWRRPALPRHL